MRPLRSLRAVTLAEMVVTLSVISILGTGLLMFGFTSSRFIARNLSTNHSHETARISAQSLLKEVRDAASAFRQFNYDGTTYSDVTSVSTSDPDVLTGQLAGNRTNGVRFRQIFAGPLAMTSSTTPTTTTLTFTFPAGTTPPVAGDKVALPLITQEYDITAVSGSGVTKTLTVSPAVGYTLNTTSPNIVTGYFYRRVAYSVWNQQLRFHPNFNGASQNTFQVVRGNITSPKPFSMIFPAADPSATDALSLRVSLEISDLGYSSRKFANSTTTLYSVIPARNQPTVLSSTN